jgi:hypothetical protein
MDDDDDDDDDGRGRKKEASGNGARRKATMQLFSSTSGRREEGPISPQPPLVAWADVVNGGNASIAIFPSPPAPPCGFTCHTNPPSEKEDANGEGDWVMVVVVVVAMDAMKGSDEPLFIFGVDMGKAVVRVKKEDRRSDSSSAAAHTAALAAEEEGAAAFVLARSALATLLREATNEPLPTDEISSSMCLFFEERKSGR